MRSKNWEASTSRTLEKGKSLGREGEVKGSDQRNTDGKMAKAGEKSQIPAAKRELRALNIDNDTRALMNAERVERAK